MQISGPQPNQAYKTVLTPTGGTGYVQTPQANIGGPWGNAENPGNTTQRYLSLGNVETTVPPTNENQNSWLAPTNGVITDFFVSYVGGATIVDTMTFTLRVGQTTQVTNTINGNFSHSFLTGLSIPYSAGDYVSIGVQQSSTAAAKVLNIRASLAGYI